LEKTAASETRYATFDFLVMSFSDVIREIIYSWIISKIHT